MSDEESMSSKHSQTKWASEMRKAYLALRPRKGDFKQHKASLGNCVVSNPTHLSFSFSFSLFLPPCLVSSIFSGGTWLQGATPHLPLLITHNQKTHYYRPDLNPSLFSPLVLLVLSQFSRVFCGAGLFKPIWLWPT